MNSHTKLQKVADVAMWIEQESSIHVKAATDDGDPLELSAAEARAVANALQRLADALEELDQR